MIGLFKSYIRGAVRRFIRNAPANRYEKVAFDAVRSALVIFGEAQPV